MQRRQFLKGTAATAGALIAKPAIAQGTTEVSFFYPIAVGGPITKLIDSFAADFEKENPSIKLKPIYSGTYQETIVKALTAHKSGKPPTTSVLLSTDMFTLIDEDAIVPIDDFVKTDDDKNWLKSFFPAFMVNSQTGGKTWGAPFQRSTIVLYWNKDLFKEAGLDPDKAPASWAEQLAFAEKLTKADGSGDASQWGMQMPSSGFPYWLFQGFTTQAGAMLMNEEGNRTFYDKPEVIEALHLLGRPVPQAQGASARHRRVGHHAQGFLREEDRHDVDHHGQPHQRPQQRQIPLRRGDASRGQAPRQPDRRRQFLHLQEGARAQQEAAFKFIRWITTPERAAQWCVDTGYVAVRPDAFETPAIKKYVADFPPAAVARDQLQFAVAELSTHENQRVTKALNDGLQAALTGTKPPEQAMKDSQAEAERVLAQYR